MIYFMSGLKKLKGNHPAMGEGKPLPGWFLLSAAFHEILTLALFPWSVSQNIFLCECMKYVYVYVYLPR